ncbi:hypothetical protein EON66_05480, partial [archaeon]
MPIYQPVNECINQTETESWILYCDIPHTVTRTESAGAITFAIIIVAVVIFVALTALIITILVRIFRARAIQQRGTLLCASAQAIQRQPSWPDLEPLLLSGEVEVEVAATSMLLPLRALVEPRSELMAFTRERVPPVTLEHVVHFLPAHQVHRLQLMEPAQRQQATQWVHPLAPHIAHQLLEAAADDAVTEPMHASPQGDAPSPLDRAWDDAMAATYTRSYGGACPVPAPVLRRSIRAVGAQRARRITNRALLVAAGMLQSSGPDSVVDARTASSAVTGSSVASGPHNLAAPGGHAGMMTRIVEEATNAALADLASDAAVVAHAASVQSVVSTPPPGARAAVQHQLAQPAVHATQDAPLIELDAIVGTAQISTAASFHQLRADMQQLAASHNAPPRHVVQAIVLGTLQAAVTNARVQSSQAISLVLPYVQHLQRLSQRQMVLLSCQQMWRTCRATCACGGAAAAPAHAGASSGAAATVVTSPGPDVTRAAAPAKVTAQADMAAHTSHPIANVPPGRPSMMETRVEARHQTMPRAATPVVRRAFSPNQASSLLSALEQVVQAHDAAAATQPARNIAEHLS